MGVNTFIASRLISLNHQLWGYYEINGVIFQVVVLTSITAICGLLPIALNPNPLITPLAIVLIGGLISSTILSRIVTPVMYKLIPPHLESDDEKA